MHKTQDNRVFILGSTIMISINELTMTFGDRLLFYDVNLNLNIGRRYALVGANGAGKSTFFNLLNHQEEPTTGEITTPKDATLGWLKQDHYRYDNTAIRQVVMLGKPALCDAIAEKEKLLDVEEWTDELGFRLGELEDTISHYHGYSAPAFAETLLTGLGIPPSSHDKPLSTLSGGYKLRVLLAQLLFQEPTILLLDEPTNHLDIVSIQWLERYLKNDFPGLVVFISHDLEFIDRLADNILDLDYGEIREYSGNYAKFLAEKQLVEEQRLKEKKNLEDRIKHMQDYVDRNRAKASKAKQAQARIKMIEKIKLPDIKQSSRIAPHFKFVSDHPSAKRVLTVKGLAKHYAHKTLFEKFNLYLNRGDKLAIMGPNGVGKSTLIKLILDIVAKDAGTVEWGVNTRWGYLSQDHHDLLTEHTSVLQWLHQHSNTHDKAIRQALAQMLFTQDEVDKDVLTLSGGESARLLLAKTILEQPNVLILDEPTNHLDLETTEALADAINQYNGTLITVSHNRHFIDKIATRILYLDPDYGVEDFEGNYQHFYNEFLSQL